MFEGCLDCFCEQVALATTYETEESDKYRWMVHAHLTRAYLEAQGHQDLAWKVISARDEFMYENKPIPTFSLLNQAHSIIESLNTVEDK